MKFEVCLLLGRIMMQFGLCFGLSFPQFVIVSSTPSSLHPVNCATRDKPCPYPTAYPYHINAFHHIPLLLPVRLLLSLHLVLHFFGMYSNSSTTLASPSPPFVRTGDKGPIRHRAAGVSKRHRWLGPHGSERCGRDAEGLEAPRPSPVGLIGCRIIFLCP